MRWLYRLGGKEHGYRNDESNKVYERKGAAFLDIEDTDHDTQLMTWGLRSRISRYQDAEYNRVSIRISSQFSPENVLNTTMGRLAIS